MGSSVIYGAAMFALMLTRKMFFVLCEKGMRGAGKIKLPKSGAQKQNCDGRLIDGFLSARTCPGQGSFNFSMTGCGQIQDLAEP